MTEGPAPEELLEPPLEEELLEEPLDELLVPAPDALTLELLLLEVPYDALDAPS